MNELQHGRGSTAPCCRPGESKREHPIDASELEILPGWVPVARHFSGQIDFALCSEQPRASCTSSIALQADHTWRARNSSIVLYLRRSCSMQSPLLLEGKKDLSHQQATG